VRTSILSLLPCGGRRIQARGAGLLLGALRQGVHRRALHLHALRLPEVGSGLEFSQMYCARRAKLNGVRTENSIQTRCQPKVRRCGSVRRQGLIGSLEHQGSDSRREARR
jgi:hypothetical protein